jgi:hypothetical protein
MDPARDALIVAVSDYRGWLPRASGLQLARSELDPSVAGESPLISRLAKKVTEILLSAMPRRAVATMSADA